MDLLSLNNRHPPGEPPVPPGEPRPVHIARSVVANRPRGRPQQQATAKGGSLHLLEALARALPLVELTGKFQGQRPPRS
eukprot:COSAG06_NODE_13297_length_1271_cov_1.558020_1_plen_78_part_01